MIELENDEGQQILNVLATTKDHPWIVTNPLILKIGQQLQRQGIGHPGPATSGDRVPANGEQPSATR